MTKHKPATPLPWILSSSFLICTDDSTIVVNAIPMDVVGVPYKEAIPNAAYIVAACNAYPTLVATLRKCHDALAELGCGPTNAHEQANALLRELGEIE